MKNLKVWIKLGIGFGVVLCIMCGLGLMAINELASQRRAAENIADAYMLELDLAVRFERTSRDASENMVRFVSTGDDKYYRESIHLMEQLEKISKEASQLVSKHPMLRKLSENLQEANALYTKVLAIMQKSHTLVVGLNARNVRLQAAATDFFNILHSTLTTAENALAQTITTNAPQAEMLARAKSNTLINDCINLGNDLQAAVSRAQSTGNPEVAEKALALFVPMNKTLDELVANALPINRPNVKKVADLASAYHNELKFMIAEWRELRQVTQDGNTNLSGLIDNAQNTATTAIASVQKLCSEAKVKSQESISLLTIGLLCGVILGLLFAWRLTRMITKPLSMSADFAVDVAGGNLSESLEIHQNDEIGVLAKSLNSMVKTLTLRIKAAQDATEEANKRKEEAMHAMKDAEIARNLAENAKRQGMLDAAEQLEDVVESVSSASQQLSAQIVQSSRGAQVQAERASETAEAMEQMNISVIDVARNASVTADVSNQARQKATEGAQVVNNVVAGMDRINTGAVGLRKDMEQLSTKAESIGNILNVISDIADQTNLLALNAAIEAARAGEAGRGFAVVADEVRKLAEKTMHATSEVGDAIRGIQDGTAMNMAKVENTVDIVNEVTRMATDSGTALREIVSLVDKASEQIRSIATASEEQSATSESISKSVAEVNTIASETAVTMQESGKAVDDLTKQALVLNKLISDMKKA